MADRKVALRGGAVVLGLLLVYAALLPRGFSELPRGAVVVSSGSSFWKKHREFVFIDGNEWCAGSEWRAKPLAVTWSRERDCLDPGHGGAVATSIGLAHQRILLVSTDVQSVEQVVGADARALAVDRRAPWFGVVRVDASAAPAGYRLVRPAPAITTEFSCAEGSVELLGACQ